MPEVPLASSPARLPLQFSIACFDDVSWAPTWVSSTPSPPPPTGGRLPKASICATRFLIAFVKRDVF